MCLFAADIFERLSYRIMIEFETRTYNTFHMKHVLVAKVQPFLLDKLITNLNVNKRGCNPVDIGQHRVAEVDQSPKKKYQLCIPQWAVFETRSPLRRRLSYLKHLCMIFEP